MKVYPQLELNDEHLLGTLFDTLTEFAKQNPYGPSSRMSDEIKALPKGLRAMAATHWLDLSLTMDSLSWHFGNFGEPGLVRETAAGLRELGLESLADCFAEMSGIMAPILKNTDEGADYDECIEFHGVRERLDKLNSLAEDLNRSTQPSPSPSSGLRSAIYRAWISYARANPDQVFPERQA